MQTLGVSGVKPPLAIIFANNKGNIGDFAILHAMLRDLERKFPGHPLKVFPHSSLSTDEPRLRAFIAAGVPGFDMSGTAFSKAVPELTKLTYYTGLWPLLRGGIAARFDTLAEPAAAAFEGSTAAFVAGGHQWGGFKGLSMFATLRAISRRGVPVHAYPFSVSGRTTSIIGAAPLTRDFARLGKPIVLRDSVSKSRLDALGLETVLGADCVYTLKAVADAVAPMNTTNPGRIIVSITAAGNALRHNLRALVMRLKLTKLPITLMTTCEMEDGPAMRDVAQEFGLEYLAPLTWQDAVAEMKSSGLVVSNRLHGLIMGSFCGVPLLPVADRGKVAAFVKDNAAAVHAPGINSIDAPLIFAALSRRAEIIASLALYQAHTASLATAPIVQRLE